MSADANGDSLQLTFGARVAEVDEATRKLRKFLLARGAEREVLSILLLFREAALNAARHGLQEAEDAVAQAQIVWEKKGVRLLIQDPGPGFDWRRASYTAPRAEADSGRGLFVLCSNADCIKFNEAGNAIELYKRFRELP
jgi:serine/threonine-protein kinase RsbW